MAVRSNELRIGNWYNDKRIDRDFVVHGINERYIEHGDSDYSATSIVNARPIDLTEDWLKRMGFTIGDNITCNDSFYEIAVGGSMLSINPNNGVVWITRNSSSINNPACIDYVHSLQNLYFALTGTELKLIL
jgi:hypothetical protein